MKNLSLSIGLLAAIGLASAAEPARLTYPIVDSGQDRCFSNTQEIAYPAEGADFYGQDAQYQGLQPSYKDNGDGTISDLNTGLMWVKTPDLKNKTTFAEAIAGAKTCRVGGHDDWRLPTIKELYSLIDFRGGCGRTVAQSTPYIDTRYFDFVFGDETKGERIIDAQYWSATEYLGKTMRNNATTFGVNFADGRIKGYPNKLIMQRGAGHQFVRYVRGNPKYGINDFADNGDGTVTDRATGLTWMKADSDKPMNWQAALKYAEELKLAGKDDWRLPNAKEMQSIVDYTRAPEPTDPKAKKGPAIDPIFTMTNPEAWYWTGTTHQEGHTCGMAIYLCVGKGMGAMQGVKMDVHGAGAQRSDPKAGDPKIWASGNGPQGDQVRILNYVRCVRGGDVVKKTTSPKLDGTYTAGRDRPAPGGMGMQGPGGMGQGGMQGPGGMGQGGMGQGGMQGPGGMGPGGMQGPGGMRQGGGQMGPGGGMGAAGFIKRLDKNGDGKVSRDEFDGPPDRFGDFDRNGDGFVTADEAPAAPPRRN